MIEFAAAAAKTPILRDQQGHLTRPQLPCPSGESLMRRLTLQAALVIVFLGFGTRLQALQVNNNLEPVLVVCNKGTVPVEVVVATRKDDASRSTLLEMMRGTGKYYCRGHNYCSAGLQQTPSKSGRAGLHRIWFYRFERRMGLWQNCTGARLGFGRQASAGRPLPRGSSPGPGLESYLRPER
jgi:hypothetical protein